MGPAEERRVGGRVFEVAISEGREDVGAGGTGVNPRSLLFVPGDDERKLAKIPSLTADLVVVDLEDAVAGPMKARAREKISSHLGALERDVASRVLVRVNPAPFLEEDIALIRSLDIAGVVIPKLESPGIANAIRKAISPRIGAALIIVGGVESIAGVRGCFTLAESGVDGLYFGAEDFIADVGGIRTAAGTEVLYARARVVMAARGAGVAAIDQAVVDVRDLARLEEDALAARSMGYTGKIALNPSQAQLINEVFTPTAAEIERAKLVIGAARGGVGVVDGMMVDAVHVRMAETLLERARMNPAGPGA